jgi:hypothetical protein
MAFPVWDELICCVQKAAKALAARVTAAEETLAGMAFGNATLVGGTIAVADTMVTANSIVVVSRKTAGGTPGTGHTYTLSAGVGFTITSTSGTDTSVVSYVIKY